MVDKDRQLQQTQPLLSIILRVEACIMYSVMYNRAKGMVTYSRDFGTSFLAWRQANRRGGTSVYWFFIRAGISETHCHPAMETTLWMKYRTVDYLGIVLLRTGLQLCDWNTISWAQCSAVLSRIDSDSLDVQLHGRHFCALQAYPSIWEFAVCLNHALDYVVLLID